MKHESKEKGRLFFPEQFRFECLQCGSCCQSWEIPVQLEVMEAIKNSEAYRRIKKERRDQDLFRFDSRRNRTVMSLENNRCPFLECGEKCAIHRELGEQAKPAPCRWFPFSAVVTPYGTYIGLDRICKSVREKRGVLIQKYNSGIKKLLIEFPREMIDVNSLLLKENLPIDWDTYEFMENHLASSLDAVESGEQTLDESLRERLVKLIYLAESAENEKKHSLSSGDAADFFNITPVIPTYQVESIIEQEQYYAMSVIVLHEVSEGNRRTESLEALLGEGEFNGRSFKGSVQTGKLKDYMRKIPVILLDKAFIEYLRHLIWQKVFLTSKTLIHAAAAYILLKEVFRWFSCTFAFLRNAAGPESVDINKSYAILESLIRHDVSEVLELHAGTFAGNVSDIIHGRPIR